MAYAIYTQSQDQLFFHISQNCAKPKSENKLPVETPKLNILVSVQSFYTHIR